MKKNSQIEAIAHDVLNKYVKRGGVYKVFPNIMKEEGLKFKEVSSQNIDFVERKMREDDNSKRCNLV